MDAVFAEQEPFSLILDAVDDGVAVYDRHGTLVWINDKICLLLGLSRTQLLGLNVSEILSLPAVETVVSPETTGRFPTEPFTPSSRIEDYESPGYTTLKNGAQIYYVVHYVRDHDGDLLYGVATLREASALNRTRKRIAELQRLATLYKEQLSTLHAHVLGRPIVCQSEMLQGVLERALRLARLDGNVLLTGETGVGKSMLAQYVHVMSRRSQGPFIQVSCASLPASLVEAELFGYSEGAFTGASRKGRRGMIEMGQGGTVFLDEIGDMPAAMQAKLLTVLEDKVMRRLGGEKLITLDVRFLASTNKAPEVLLREGSLRKDLYYRLAVNRIDIPPLRERPEDVPALVESALTEFNEKNGTSLVFRLDLVERLQILPLAGNVRELKNLVWQIASESEEDTGEITAPMVPDETFQRIDTLHALTAGAGVNRLTRHSAAGGEKQELLTLLEQHRGDVYTMANALGVHRTTVIRRLRSHGIGYPRRRRSRSAAVTARVSV